jgi:hypothetical protein
LIPGTVTDTLRVSNVDSLVLAAQLVADMRTANAAKARSDVRAAAELEAAERAAAEREAAEREAAARSAAEREAAGRETATDLDVALERQARGDNAVRPRRRWRLPRMPL